MQVTKSGLLRIDTDLPERGLDPLQQVRTAVIALNQRFHISHAPSPGSGVIASGFPQDALDLVDGNPIDLCNL